MGEEEATLQLYREMQQESLRLDEKIIIVALQACYSLARKEEATYVNMYGSCGRVAKVENVFVGLVQYNLVAFNVIAPTYVDYGKGDLAICLFRLLEQNVVSWTLLLHAYLELGEEEATLQLYREMQQERLHPDEQIIVVSLQACCSLARKEEVAYVDIYGSCGKIAEAENVFAGLVQHNLVAFNVMVPTYVECGKGDLSIRLFRQMHERGVQTDERTIVIAMQACFILANNETSMTLESGWSLHYDAFRRGFCSNSFIKCTILTMYKQCGSLVDIENTVTRIQNPSTSDLA
ncbi:hypothetical protein L7F22_054740 [Adiantum nelumboides]|nr:hypothetical protein [Adiantum nelumboides]